MKATGSYESVKTKKEVRKVGVKWASKQCRELLEFGVPGLHFFTLGESDNIRQILAAIH